MSILRLYQYLETKRQSQHSTRVSRQKIVNAPRHRPNIMLECGEEILEKETAKLNEKPHALRVLRDLSEASLTRAIEESLAAFQVSLARLPGAEVSDQPNLLWVA